MLSIGEFSKLCLVTTKTLRHYDSIGLLKPIEHNEENGYRYYSVEQLSTMLKIIRLRDYSFTLEEIGNLLNADNHTLSIAIKNKLSEKEVLLKQQHELIKKMKTDIINLEKGDFMKSEFNITLEQTKDTNIAFVKETISIKDFCKIMQKLYSLGLPMEGAPIAIYHDKEFNPENTLVEVAYPTSATTENTRVLKGQLCAKCVSKGDYSNLPAAYSNVVKWIEENGYIISNPPYDKYINDPAKTPTAELITEIYFPIAK